MPLRRGNGQPSAAPAADVITTRDGQIVLSAYMQEHFARLCATIGPAHLAHDERFATNQARVANRPALVAVLRDALSHLTPA